MRAAQAVLLYDGECGFCLRGVRFVYRRDPRGRVHFASLQSDAGRRLLRAHGMAEEHRESLVLVADGHAFDASEGALRAARLLRWPWSWLGALGLLAPRRARDAVYRQVARRRHRCLHGRACPVPPPEVRARFLS